MSYEIKNILKSLLEIKSNVEANRFPTYGLCGTFKEMYGESLGRCMNLYGISFKDWHYYSGDTKFPVPYPSMSHYADEAYYAKDKYKGEYGKLRMHLLDWLIDQFQSKINC
jgi:hypothetical protein